MKNKNTNGSILESIDIRFWYAVREYFVPVCDCCERHDPLSKWLFFCGALGRAGGVSLDGQWEVHVWGSRAELMLFNLLIRWE